MAVLGMDARWSPVFEDAVFFPRRPNFSFCCRSVAARCLPERADVASRRYPQHYDFFLSTWFTAEMHRRIQLGVYGKIPARHAAIYGK